MFSILLEHKMITGTILLLFFVSILLQFVIGRFLTVLIRETENMASTDKSELKECKRKFTNSFRANNGILNVSVFVDKFLNKMCIGRMSLQNLKHLSGQFMLLSVFTAGIGACRGIILGKTLGEILPFYIISLFGLYIFFSVGGAVDISGKRRILKVNIVDYLENNMVNKLSVLEEDIKIIEQDTTEEQKVEKKKVHIGRKEETELEELLKEYLT